MRRRSLATAAAALASVVASLAGPAPVASAAIPGDPHSPVVIELAAAAVHAHDVFSWAKTPDAFVGYLRARNATADAVAVELGIDAAALRSAWARADLARQEAVLAALSQIGAAYVRNTSDPAVGFDCSGLTAYAWGRAGVTLSRQSGAQIGAARSVQHAEAKAGDLAHYPGHVMLYLGVDDAIVHAANHDRDVAIGTLSRAVTFGDPSG